MTQEQLLELFHTVTKLFSDTNSKLDMNNITPDTYIRLLGVMDRCQGAIITLSLMLGTMSVEEFEIRMKVGKL